MNKTHFTNIKISEECYRTVLSEVVDGETLGDVVYKMAKFYKSNKTPRKIKIPPMPSDEFL